MCSGPEFKLQKSILCNFFQSFLSAKKWHCRSEIYSFNEFSYVSPACFHAIPVRDLFIKSVDGVKLCWRASAKVWDGQIFEVSGIKQRLTERHRLTAPSCRIARLKKEKSTVQIRLISFYRWNSFMLLQLVHWITQDMIIIGLTLLIISMTLIIRASPVAIQWYRFL